jgi:hypothetical protein
VAIDLKNVTRSEYFRPQPTLRQNELLDDRLAEELVTIFINFRFRAEKFSNFLGLAPYPKGRLSTICKKWTTFTAKIINSRIFDDFREKLKQPTPAPRGKTCLICEKIQVR